ncbi:hypothetical protein, partial [Pseudomonas poae]|uniref:hypothetical protein n=1 Tax=Pseudomonas poae TaxID=200451 RepID=UPI001F1843D6
PALGCEAPPVKEHAVYLTPRGVLFWGCCAAQRRTSLLATGNLRLTERHWGNACSPRQACSTQKNRSPQRQFARN